MIKNSEKPVSDHPLSNADFIFFMSSSGHCSLDCSYCIVNPIVKHQPSLTLQDIEYLLDSVGGKSAIAFSGKGDFFAGYRKGDKLLSRLLDREVDVGLDINGVMIHEFPDLSDEKLNKIRHINLTLHYVQIKNKNALKVWEQNAKLLIRKQRCHTFLMGTILSPHDVELWEEALRFYDHHVFQETGMRITLIRDVLNWESRFEERLESLRNKFDYLVAETRHVDFSQMFKMTDEVICPAGKAFFRVWNDGRIEGCPYIGELSDCGNAMARTFAPRETFFRCSQPKYCDCNLIGRLGKMQLAAADS
jgi:MoaA/NifB/PqqE/SkfB family radical SAM enzyme